MTWSDCLANGAVAALEVVPFALKVLWIVVRDSLLGLLPKNKKSLDGEVVLITGSGQGMGKEVAIRMARLGAKVVLWDINKVKVKEVAENITNEGWKAFWYTCDVTSEKDVISKAKMVEEEVGEVSILVNNAGIMQNLPILELDSAKIKQTFDVNLMSHFWTIRAFLPNMEKKSRGHIVAIASGAGLIGHVNQTDYSASKHGVVGLMEAFSEELRQKGSSIKLTTICPLTVNTGMNQNPSTKCSWMMPIVSLDEAAKQIVDSIRREDVIVSIPKSLLHSLRLGRLFPWEVITSVLDFSEYCRVPNSKSTEIPSSPTSKTK